MAQSGWSNTDILWLRLRGVFAASAPKVPWSLCNSLSLSPTAEGLGSVGSKKGLC